MCRFPALGLRLVSGYVGRVAVVDTTLEMPGGRDEPVDRPVHRGVLPTPVRPLAAETRVGPRRHRGRRTGTTTSRLLLREIS